MSKIKSETARYIIPDRLSDVITLISVLATDSQCFRTEEGLTIALRSNPKTSASWIKLATEHSEFFRLNGDGKFIALLLRSYLPEEPDGEGKYIRPPLTIDETQNLINSAIALHDKEINRLQRKSYRIPIITALIASVTALLISAVTTYTSRPKPDTALYNKIDSTIQLLQQLHSKPDTLKPSSKTIQPMPPH